MSDFNLAQDLEQAFNSIGHSMMNDDFACKILAYLNVCGNDERVVLHKGFGAGLAIAAQKLNLKGGEVPNAKLLPLLHRYISELRDAIEYTEVVDGKSKIKYKSDSEIVCDWLQEIADRYQIVIFRYKPTTK